MNSYLCRWFGHRFSSWHTCSHFGQEPPFLSFRCCSRCDFMEVNSPKGFSPKHGGIFGRIQFVIHPAKKDVSDDGRTKLPDRRTSIRDKLKYQDSRGSDHFCEVSYGFDADGAIREVFCIAHKDGTDMQGIVHDACIATSIALQRGARIADLAKSFGELRGEGDAAGTGAAASVIGALARHGAALEIQLWGGE